MLCSCVSVLPSLQACTQAVPSSTQCAHKSWSALYAEAVPLRAEQQCEGAEYVLHQREAEGMRWSVMLFLRLISL